MPTPATPRRRSHRPTAGLVVAVVAFIGATGCSSDSDEAATAASATTTTMVTTAADDGVEAFCAAAPKADDEVPEAYVGSAENVADLQDLAALAPRDVADDLGAIADHFEAEVDPADPDSQLTDTFPDEVNARIADVTTYIEETCG